MFGFGKKRPALDAMTPADIGLLIDARVESNASCTKSALPKRMTRSPRASGARVATNSSPTISNADPADRIGAFELTPYAVLDRLLASDESRCSGDLD